jgi:hypothetical protein
MARLDASSPRSYSLERIVLHVGTAFHGLGGNTTMEMQIVSAGMLLLCSMGLAGQSEDRSKLMGKWELQGQNKSAKSLVWVVEDKGDSIRITRSVGDQIVSDFQCNVGQECKVKDSGKSATVTMYFNGPRLVELETRGSDVVKRRFAAASKEDTMEVEVIPLLPAGGSNETLVFKRVSVSPSK